MAKFKKILRKSEGSLSKVKCLCLQNYRYYYVLYIQNIEDRIHIRIYKITKERVANFCQFISGKVKKSEAEAKWRFSYK